MLAGARSQPAPKAPAPKAAAPPRTLTTGANPRGVAITPGYQHAVRQVFHAQPARVKQAIVRAAARNPSHPAAVALGISKAYGREPGGAMALEPRGLSAIQQSVAPLTAAQVKQDENLGNFNPLGDLGKGIVGGLAALRSATQIGASGPGNTATFGTMGPRVASNAAKDLVNLPAETISTVGTVGGDVLKGKPGKALSDVVSPYVQMAEHPAQAFIDHPLLTTLMATGALHGASRLAAAPVRALANPESAVGRAVSTERPGVWLTGKLTHERPRFSQSPTVKLQQKAVEKSLYEQGPGGMLRHQDTATGRFLRARQLNQEVGQLAGVRNRIRVANQREILATHAERITPGTTRLGRTAARAAHGVKTALKYGPKGARIPGADVIERIADATVRRPETFTQDLQKHMEQVAANRPNLTDQADIARHDAYIRTLQKEIKANRSPASLKRAFQAVAQDHKDYALLEQQAFALGHFGPDMNKEGLFRRTLQPYAVTHMGAKMDPERGLVDAQGKPLPTDAILAQLKGPEGTGGRMPTYTSHKVLTEKKTRGSFYKGEGRPTPKSKSNTLYAYPHGLTNPTDQGMLLRNVELRSAIDAHRAQNTYLDQLANQLPGGGYGRTYSQAEAAGRPYGLVPVNTARVFHPQVSLDKAMEGVDPLAAEEQAQRMSLDLSERMRKPENDTPGKGRWALIDPATHQVLKEHQGAISPGVLVRTIRGLNTQFRTVALSTSAKHIPGVTQENLIRDIAAGVGFRSWLTGHRAIGEAVRQNPELGKELRVHLTGGQVAGMTDAARVYHVADHWNGTTAEPFLKGWARMSQAPGLRQARTLWRGWTRIAIQGTKKVLEEQHQIAGLGKTLLREHGYAEAAKVDGFVGMFHRTLGLHGQMLEDAVRGLFDPAKARQMRAEINRMYGKWTDLSPSAQTALMFSPFGLWWANSVRFLARMPVDQPVKTSLLASATAGTQQERQAQGLDMFMPGALPLYEQGGIPVGGKIIAQNYYSPFGVANDPAATATSLLEPWLLTPANTLAFGLNWLGKPLTAPGQNTNRGNEKTPGAVQRAQYVIDSVLASFVPLYMKADQIASGGASRYDVTPSTGILPPLLRGKAPLTKTPGKGFAAGLQKAVLPVREYKKAGASGSSGGGYVLGGGGASSSSGYTLGSGGGSSSGGSGYVLGSGH